MRRLSRAYYRSKARAHMNKVRRSVDSRYAAKRTPRAATVIGAGLIVVGGMEYPASDVTDDKGTVVAVANANRPASAVYAPAYGQTVAVKVGTSANKITSTDRTGETAEATYLLIDGSRPGATVDPQTFASGIIVGNDTDYMETDSSGTITLHGAATVWDDIRVEPVARSTGTNAPSFTQWFTDGAGSRGVYLYLFDNAAVGSQKEVHFTLQLPHSWAGTEIHLHVHWIAATSNASSAVRWGLEYTWAEPNQVFGNTTLIYAVDPVSGDTGTTAYKHQITEFAGLTPDSSQDGLSSILICRLWRDSANAADTYSGDVGLLYIDAHYEIDKMGSNSQYA